ncbi:MAG: hypothetical protein D6B28_05730 [Gammaproteobacteria bacterium]|nr:MAG: hypothetical protein D6B28_05730 [Gammaproteobacteria bacterium]
MKRLVFTNHRTITGRAIHSVHDLAIITQLDQLISVKQAQHKRKTNRNNENKNALETSNL